MNPCNKLTVIDFPSLSLREGKRGRIREKEIDGERAIWREKEREGERETDGDIITERERKRGRARE